MALDHLIDIIFSHGDIGHIALVLWGACASLACISLFKEIKAANRRFDHFVRELHAFNSYLLGDED